MTEVIIHQVVGAILLNDRGEVLLQQRDEKPGLRYPGYWTFFGGAVEAGETPDDAIKRELWEELELELPLTFWKQYECPARTIPGQQITINHVYIGTMTRDLATLTLHEGQAMGYFSPVACESIELAFMQSPLLAAFFDTTRKVMSIALACAWQPRGELGRLKYHFWRLQNIYDHIVISLRKGDPDQTEICETLEQFNIRYEFYYGWSGRHTCLRLALKTPATHIHYVDMDRLVRWVELSPRELKEVAERTQMFDSLIIGRTPEAYQTHPRTLVETEALPNMIFSQYLGRRMDFSAGSRGLSRRAAELVVENSSDADSLALDCGWAVLVHRANLTWDYVEVAGLDWETADRFRNTAADAKTQRSLAAEENVDVKSWSHRVWVAREIVRGGLEAMTRPIPESEVSTTPP